MKSSDKLNVASYSRVATTAQLEKPSEESNNAFKRVRTLYRVSTKGQVDKEDIPLQRIECHRFCDGMQDWKIVKEHEEKGISGYLVSAKDRDEVQELLVAANKGEFDVLLVFKFDRIGRIDDETPLLVHEFVKLGIEVWSTQEGQRKFDCRMDNLTNYLYFWQAQTESENTSIRVRTRNEQLTESGLYTGGGVSFGYETIFAGRTNKKDLPIKDIAVNEIEAVIVREIFNKTVYEGYGSHRLATYINNQNIKTHFGNNFQSNTINRILKNERYLGYIINGKAKSSHIQELQIIDKKVYEQAQVILEKRKTKNQEKQYKTRITKSNVMLSGFIFCGHCGSRLTPTTYRDRYTRKDGTVYSIDEMKYTCYHKSRKLCECDGQTSYKADLIDNAIISVIKGIFNRSHCMPDTQAIQREYKKKVQSKVALQCKRWTEITKIQKKITSLENEILNSLIGESVFTTSQLSGSIKSEQERLQIAQTVYEETEKSIISEKKSISSILPKYNDFLGWAEEFEQATKDRQKQIISMLIESVTVHKGYSIDIDFNIGYKEYCNGWHDEKEQARKVS